MAKKTHQQQRERSWPSPQDYNEALQNPDFSFNDPELRRCVPETDALGFPRPTSGAFASVYRVECGECSYAVRCFFRGIQDQKERYAHISQYIASDDLPYTVKFEYQERGIRIGGSWFPIVKMDWVAGETLDKYVTRHSNHRKKMEYLVRRFATMCSDLRTAGIAHGDLQHGNILVLPDGQLRLVDYDGMFVPAMKGWRSNELGHRNYQHPARTAEHFGPELDNFAAWVIYSSLCAVVLESSIYKQLGGGDDCLLLRRGDFDNAGQSQVFRQLSSLGYPISSHVKTLQSLLEFSPLTHVPLPAPPSLLMRWKHNAFSLVELTPPVKLEAQKKKDELDVETWWDKFLERSARKSPVVDQLAHAGDQLSNSGRTGTAIPVNHKVTVKGRVIEKGTYNKPDKEGNCRQHYWIYCKYSVNSTGRSARVRHDSISIAKHLWDDIYRGQELNLVVDDAKGGEPFWDSFTDKRFAGELETPLNASKRRIRSSVHLSQKLSIVVAILFALAFAFVLHDSFLIALWISVSILCWNVTQLNQPVEKHIIKTGIAVRGRITGKGFKTEIDSEGNSFVRYWVAYEYPILNGGYVVGVSRKSIWVTGEKWYQLSEGESLTILYDLEKGQDLIYKLSSFRAI